MKRKLLNRQRFLLLPMMAAFWTFLMTAPPVAIAEESEPATKTQSASKPFIPHEYLKLTVKEYATLDKPERIDWQLCITDFVMSQLDLKAKGGDKEAAQFHKFLKTQFYSAEPENDDALILSMLELHRAARDPDRENGPAWKVFIGKARHVYERQKESN